MSCLDPRPIARQCIDLFLARRYIVTCNFSQLAGAGFHMAGAQRWQSKSDGRAAVAWNNQTIQTHVVVYYLSL